MNQKNTSENALRETITPKEWQARVDLAAFYRLAEIYQWSDLIFTHISLRVPGEANAFLINPLGLLFEEITPLNLVKIDFNGNKLLASEFDINPAGFIIHSAIHEHRTDAHCVCHFHTPAGVSVSSSAQGLLPLNQTALTVIDDLAYHDYEGIALEPGEQHRIVENLGEKRFMVFRNHGTLALGKNCASAFLAMYMLEQACKFQQQSLSTTSDPIQLPVALVERVTQQVRQQQLFEGRGGDIVWPAMLRKVARHFPDWHWA